MVVKATLFGCGYAALGKPARFIPPRQGLENPRKLYDEMESSSPEFIIAKGAVNKQ